MDCLESKNDSKSVRLRYHFRLDPLSCGYSFIRMEALDRDRFHWRPAKIFANWAAMEFQKKYLSAAATLRWESSA